MEALFWLLWNLFSVAASGFYSMIEMACVSVHRSRLQFYALEGSRRAMWLQRLLAEPSRLFGTTLVGVNLATVVGSECAREFHAAIGIDPDLAPVSQVILVVIFGELAPMFAARQYAEHAALLGAPLLYLSERILSPFLVALSYFMRLVYRLLGQDDQQEFFVSKDELQRMLEEHEAQGEPMLDRAFKNISSSLFKMHVETVGKVMKPIEEEPLLPFHSTVAQLRAFWLDHPARYALLYRGRDRAIAGVITPKDLFAKGGNLASSYSTPPWFVTQNTPLSHVIRQFRRNNQEVAIILNPEGVAVGVVTFVSLINEVFGFSTVALRASRSSSFWERTLPGSMTVADFEEQFGCQLGEEQEQTLSELIVKKYGHYPNAGDKILLYDYEVTVKETSLLGVKVLSVRGHS